MPSTLSNLFSNNGLNAVGVKAFSNPFSDRPLPNGAGVYDAAATSGPVIKPAPIFTGIKPVAQQLAPVVATPVVAAPASSFYDKYKDPKTGKVMTPEEYAIYLGNKVPKGNGEITNYAGGALSNPNQSAAELTDTATNLNNSRNDIATGTADPYKVGAQSGVAYSPAELKAIENAYAGVYDPALQDVFSRLKTTQDAEKAKTDLQQAKELEVFKTNEAVRQWRATTGTKSSGGATGTSDVKDMFSQTQVNNGASNAGLGIDAFNSLDPDIKNFYINTPMTLDTITNKKVPIADIFDKDFKDVINGDKTTDEVVADINGSLLSPAVKTYFINRMPAAPEKKQGWIEQAWNGAADFIKGALNN